MQKSKTKGLSPEAQMKFARKVKLAAQLLEFSRPIIHMKPPSDINIEGKGPVSSLQFVHPGQTISFNSSLREMIKTYALYDEPQKAALKDVKINGVMTLGKGDVALITDEAIFCTMDISAACRNVIYGGRYKGKRNVVEKEDINVILEKHIKVEPTQMPNSDISIRQIVDKCMAESVPILGIASSDAETIQRIGVNGKITGVKIKELREGDVIILGPQCMDQYSGEGIDNYDTPVNVTNVCQIGKEFFALTNVGLITDADLTYQIELAMEGVECSIQEYPDLLPVDEEYEASMEFDKRRY